MTASPPYYIEPKAAPHSFKPYDRRRVLRDLKDARTASVKLSARIRRRKAGRRGHVEAQIVALRG